MASSIKTILNVVVVVAVAVLGIAGYGTVGTDIELSPYALDNNH